jgi:peptidoglycan hydrolase-like protein with peptidoglycan-binding domain
VLIRPTYEQEFQRSALPDEDVTMPIGGRRIEVNGKLDASTWDAIRAFERSQGLPPTSAGGLGALYAHLLRVKASLVR